MTLKIDIQLEVDDASKGYVQHIQEVCDLVRAKDGVKNLRGRVHRNPDNGWDYFA